jgi:serine/threonine protein kinase
MLSLFVCFSTIVAPEVLVSKDGYDEKVDVWAIGEAYRDIIDNIIFGIVHLMTLPSFQQE